VGALLQRNFLAKLLELSPQHYAMAYLGFMTGGRVSLMITLRRSVPYADIALETGRVDAAHLQRDVLHSGAVLLDEA
jgi:hypothetical protein